MSTLHELTSAPSDLSGARDGRATAAMERDALRLRYDELRHRNEQLLLLLAQQQLEVEALQTFVIAVSRAVAATRMPFSSEARRLRSRQQLATLTERQREILSMVVGGAPSKRIASTLGISQRTVENHRAAIMLKTGSGSLPELAQLALIADLGT